MQLRKLDYVIVTSVTVSPWSREAILPLRLGARPVRRRRGRPWRPPDTACFSTDNCSTSALRAWALARAASSRAPLVGEGLVGGGLGGGGLVEGLLDGGGGSWRPLGGGPGVGEGLVGGGLLLVDALDRLARGLDGEGGGPGAGLGRGRRLGRGGLGGGGLDDGRLGRRPGGVPAAARAWISSVAFWACFAKLGGGLGRRPRASPPP